jgi:Fe-S oxidoreductase
MDIRSLLAKMAKGRWGAAYKVLRDATVFPGIVSVLCEQPCRDCCQRVVLGDEPIAVRDLEAACVRYAKDRRPESYAVPAKNQRVAVVGAGPAGLSCALHLAQKRYQVTVFERQEGWGGALRTHPRFAEFDSDLALQFSAVQVDFRYGEVVQTLDELEGFDAVYVATGSEGDPWGLRPGWDDTLFTTAVPKVFAGGALCGAGLMQGIAQGAVASKVIETFLQTGKPSLVHGATGDKDCGRFLTHEGAASVPLVQASGPEGYTEDEAKREAARCLQCDCDLCIEACEMLKAFRKDPHKIADEVYTDMGANPPTSSRSLTREAYSCNICGYCKSVCPVGVNMGPLLQLSRTARMSAGVHPAALHDFWLREMDFATTEGSFASAAKGKQTCEYAFYPGCQLGASNPTHVLRSYGALSETYDAGIFLGCCGAPAYWAGDDARLRADLESTERTWDELGRPTLVFACATCMALFRLFLPHIPRVSLYELLAASDGSLPAGPFARAAVFDPCAARGDAGMESAVRALAAKAGVALEELKEHNRCCGYGGHIRTANPSLYDEITRNRAEASDNPYIVYCANCKEVFVAQHKECAHVLDLVFGLDPGCRVPSLEDRRDNSLMVKRELMKQIQDKDFQPESHPWDSVTLVIPDGVQQEMDSRLISAADVKEAIWLAERSGDKLYDESDGSYVCSMVKPVLTYWVRYRETAPDTYEIVRAYYHRMRFDQGGQTS